MRVAVRLLSSHGTRFSWRAELALPSSTISIGIAFNMFYARPGTFRPGSTFRSRWRESLGKDSADQTRSITA